MPRTRIAAYRALTERHVERALHGQAWALTTEYERAVHDPVATICRISNLLGCPSGEVEVTRDLPVTEPGRRGTNASARTNGWKTVLSSPQIDRIFKVVAEIYPTYLKARDPAAVES